MFSFTTGLILGGVAGLVAAVTLPKVYAYAAKKVAQVRKAWKDANDTGGAAGE